MSERLLEIALKHEQKGCKRAADAVMRAVACVLRSQPVPAAVARWLPAEAKAVLS